MYTRHAALQSCVQEQEEALERAKGRYEHVIANPVAQQALPRVQAAMLQESNRAMLAELQHIAQQHPKLGVLEALDAAGLSGPFQRDQSLTLDREASFTAAWSEAMPTPA